MTLAIIIAKMIRSISQPRLTCRCPQTHPFISRDMLRYSCSKPKEKNCHSGYLHTKLSQYDNNSRVPACLRVQCTFSASVPVFTNTSVSGFTKTNCNNPSNISHTWPACDTTQLKKNPGQKTWKQTRNKVSCFVSKYSSKQFPLPTQFRSSPLTYSNTCSTQTLPQLQFNPRMLPDASEKSRSTFPNRWCPHVSFSLTPLSTNNLNTKFHCAFSAMTVPISLSQHSSTYTARQTTMLQASISRSPVSANIRHAPLFLHTIEPQVFNYSRLISQMWQLNQGHWQSKLDPPGSHAKIFSFQLPSPGMTPGSVAPRTVHSVRPGSTTTWPTCRDVTLSHSTFLVWTYAAPCHPAHFLSTSFQCFLVILQALSLSLPKSPSFLVTLQALVAKVTTTISPSLAKVTKPLTQ